MKATQSNGQLRPSAPARPAVPSASAYQLPAQAQLPPNDRFIRLKEVLTLVGLSRTSLYTRIKQGQFPAQIKLSRRCSVWSEHAVIEWMEQQKTGGDA